MYLGYNIASSVNLIIAQRLARRLCPECKQAEVIPEHELLRLGFAQAQITQALPPLNLLAASIALRATKESWYLRSDEMSDEIARTIMEGGNSLQIASQAKRKGMRDLRQSGLLKVIHQVDVNQPVLCG